MKLLYMLALGNALLLSYAAYGETITLENRTEHDIIAIVEHDDIESASVRSLCPAYRINLDSHASHVIERAFFANVVCPFGAIVFAPCDGSSKVARVTASDFPSFTTSVHIVVTDTDGKFQATAVRG